MEKVSNYRLPEGFAAPHEISGFDIGTPILVAFSGGSDSASLLHMMRGYADMTGTPIYAAHVNHGIRGDEADRDEQFCRSVAKEYGIEIFVLNADVPSIARERRLSVETAAREVRYEFFARIMEEQNIPILAVAHNADDNLETVLFNISRGSGLSGVSGIPKTRELSIGVMIRPILAVSKSDINK